MLDKLNKFLRLSPNWLRYPLYLIPIDYRLGGQPFKDMLNEIENVSKMDKESIIKYQNIKLNELMEYCVKKIPFYRDIKLLETKTPIQNLKRFPIIDKETIQETPDKFLNNNISKKSYYEVTTGGTSGNALVFCLDKNTYGMEWAHIVKIWNEINYKIGDKIIAFRGVDFNRRNNGFRQINPIYNAMEFSPFNMSDDNLKIYHKKIIDFNPKFIHGYPSSITEYCSYIQRNNEKVPQISGIFAGSENIYPEQVNFIEGVMNVRVLSWYGQTEKVILGGECRDNRSYHLFPTYGFTEFLSDEGEILDYDAIGCKGELVGTGFLNRVMPLLRYRTGDQAVIEGWGCDKCQSNFPMIREVKGRWNQEFIIAKDYSKIFMTALNMHSTAFINVRAAQFIQDAPGMVQLIIIRAPNYSDHDTKQIIKSIKNKVGDNLDVEIVFEDEIIKTERGKSKLLIQNCKL